MLPPCDTIAARFSAPRRARAPQAPASQGGGASALCPAEHLRAAISAPRVLASPRSIVEIAHSCMLGHMRCSVATSQSTLVIRSLPLLLSDKAPSRNGLTCCPSISLSFPFVPTGQGGLGKRRGVRSGDFSPGSGPNIGDPQIGSTINARSNCFLRIRPCRWAGAQGVGCRALCILPRSQGVGSLMPCILHAAQRLMVEAHMAECPYRSDDVLWPGRGAGSRIVRLVARGWQRVVQEVRHQLFSRMLVDISFFQELRHLAGDAVRQHGGSPQIFRCGTSSLKCHTGS